MTYTPSDLEVLVLAHKRPAFLREALACYRAQTVQGFRLAVYANGGCPEIKDIAREFDAELFYEEKDLGMYPNIRRAIDGARGKLTILAHDDDLIAPSYVEHLLRAFNRLDGLTLAISRQGDYEHPGGARADACIYCPAPAYLAAYIFTGGSFTFSSFCAKTDALKKTDISLNAPYGKVTDVPFMFQMLGPAEASCVLAWPFVKYRLHDGQDCVDYATGPTAEEWLNLTGFYKKIFDAAGGRFKCFFALQSLRHVRIGWRDWCRCEHNRMTYRQYLRLARQKGLLSFTSRVLGALLRGKISHFLQRRLVKFTQTNY